MKRKVEKQVWIKDDRYFTDEDIRPSFNLDGWERATLIIEEPEQTVTISRDDVLSAWTDYGSSFERFTKALGFK